ncbi:TonB-dependent receptor [Altererythrobacter salegens]|uniref:TonB-dependent receptor n=1 Tax=Croceibacterium salegens TaxID=1737568 RepID=A0A6I4SWR5_9SPHN|nr:TonB-dependent receptor [Croceibacterium salegens]MXO59789.1 TonB-dependent receptor [Croceibacterium salegens]
MKIEYLLAASLASLSVAIALPQAAQAQQITTGVSGTVADESGNPIPGATVVVTDTRTGSARTLTTNANGDFSATNLVTGGPYTVSANADGYEGQSVNDVTTSLQGDTTLTFALSLGGGEIIVTSARVQLAQLAIGPGTSFAGEVLETAPSFNRDVRDVIRIDPRVSLDRDDTGSGQDRISCLGGNDRGNAFTVDGISQGDVFGLNDTGFSSRSSTPIPYDAVRETQVQFAPFDVDYGQFTGCAINVVTKSGTNDYHFGGFYEYSDDGLRGNTVDGIPVAAIKSDKRWGFYADGPIIKDHLFIFGAYEHQEAGQSQDSGVAGAGFPIAISQVTQAQFDAITSVLSSVYGIDSGPLVYNRDFTNDRYFVRADWQITDNHRLEVTYQRLEEGTTKEDDQAVTGSFGGTAVGLNTFYTSGTESNYYSGRLYSQWTDNFSTELRYSRSEVQDLQDPIGGGEAQSANPIPRIVVGIDNGGGSYGAVEVGPGYSRSANDLQTTIDQWRAAAIYEVGDHKFKFGGEYNKADLFNLFVQNATGTLVFRNLADLQAGMLSPGTGNFDTFNTPFGVATGSVEGAFGNFSYTGDVNDAAASFKREIFSLFAQDDWQLSDRLSTTLGLRVDWYKGGHPLLNQTFVDRYGFGNDAGFDNLDPVWMPRFGFTYDFDDFSAFSRAQLRGGLGVFSGGDPLVWFGNAFQNDGRGFATGTSQSSNCPAGQISVLDGSGNFTGVPTCIQQDGIDRAAAGLGDAQSISPDIRMPTVWRANLGFSTAVDVTTGGFLSGWNLNLDYIYSHYRNPFTVVDLSQTPNITKGLNGYSIDGRPVYAAIDPTAAGCGATLVGLNPGPVFENVTAACFATSRDDELMLTNGPGFDSHIASFMLSKSFNGGLITQGGHVFFSVGYAYTDAHDRRNMYNSTAGSNYDRTAAFDRQNPAESRGFYSSKINFTMNTTFTEQFFGDNDTKLGITFVVRHGRPYSLTFRGGGVFNDSASGSDNALAYIPSGINDPNVSPLSNMTAVADFADWAADEKCARDYVGSSIPRNTCEGDRYYDMDLYFSQEIPGPASLFGFGHDKIKLYGTIDNFLNIIDDRWNVQRRRDFSGLQDVASTSGVDSEGRYIITGFNGAQAIADDNFINFSSSVWRMKIGISYDF